VSFGPLAAEIGLPVWSTPANFNGFGSWLRYCTDVAQRRSTKLCTMLRRFHGLVHYINMFGGYYLGLRASGNLPVSYVLTGNLPVTYHQ